MENKYYIPEIEEFSVGFEFECKPWINGVGRSVEWVTTNDFSDTYFGEDNDSISSIVEDLAGGSIRVKYLDQEDIESMGFKLDPIRSYFNYRNSFSLINEPYKLSLDHIYNENKIILREHKVDYPTKTLFEGTIKNLSELRKLLKQIKYE